MFKIFKRRKDKPALTYGVVQRLSETVERKQRKVADYLNNKTRKFSRKQWIWMLSVFCIVSGSIAVDIFFNGIRHPENKEPIQNISVPAFISKGAKATDSLELMEEIYQHRKDSAFQKQNVHH